MGCIQQLPHDQIHYMTISLRLGRFVYAPGDKGWHIVEMDLF